MAKKTMKASVKCIKRAAGGAAKVRKGFPKTKATPKAMAKAKKK